MSEKIRKIVRGFTLIELLIVVVIISVLAAVAAPMFLTRIQRSDQEDEADRASEPIRQAPPSAEAAVRSDGDRGRPPVIESSTVRIDLTASHVLDGFGVLTQYDADFSGTFVVRNVDPVVDTITLRFPFPPGINEARGVSLRFQEAGGSLDEPAAVTYGLEGIGWTGAVAPGDAVTAVVAYTAQGRDSFVYDVAGSGRSGTVQVDLQLHNAPRAVVPASALQPAYRQDAMLQWRLDALITNKSIVVELPAGTSPLGRVILLLQLAGVAVLVFGGGFWYLSEAQHPGRLDDFRWGHFLLLALNYSLFFGIFAVLGYGGSAAAALVIAAAVTIPLLTLHTIHVTDLRFALRRVLPLAVFTVGTVVAGVFLDQHRPLLFLAVFVVTIAFLTLTYRPWAAARRSHWTTKEAQHEFEQRLDEVESLVEGLRELVQEHELVHFEAERALEDAPAGFQAERREVDRHLALHEEALETARSLTGAEPGLEELNADWGVTPCEDLRASVEKGSRLLAGRGKGLQRIVGMLATAASEETDRLRVQLGALQRAVADASSVEVEARALAEESDESLSRERADVEQALGRLGEARLEALQWQRAASRNGGDVQGRASTAEHHARGVSALVSLLNEADERLRASTRQAQELERLLERGGVSSYCLSCGGALTPGQSFCAGCGTPRPLEVECAGCGLTTQLPQHLLRKRWERDVLHCSSCGRPLPSEVDAPASAL